MGDGGEEIATILDANISDCGNTMELEVEKVKKVLLDKNIKIDEDIKRELEEDARFAEEHGDDFILYHFF